MWEKAFLLDFFFKNVYIIYGERRMVVKKVSMLIPFVFEKILFDPSMQRYSFKLVEEKNTRNKSKEDKQRAIHIPIYSSGEEMVALPFLLTDPLVRNILRALHVRVTRLVLEKRAGQWEGKVYLRWGIFSKRVNLRVVEVIRLAIEFHKPIEIAKEFVQSVVVAEDQEAQKMAAYRALFMPRHLSSGIFPREEIM